MTRREEILIRLNAYRACETAILTGSQEYRVEDKLFKRPDLEVVQAVIKQLEGELAGLGGDPTLPSGYTRKTMRTQRAFFRRW